MLGFTYQPPVKDATTAIVLDGIAVYYKLVDNDKVEYTVHDSIEGESGKGSCTPAEFFQAVRACWDNDELTEEEYELAEAALANCPVRWIP